MTKKYIFKKNKSDLIVMAQKYKKINQEEFQNDDFLRKPYINTMNLDDIRYKYRIENNLVSSVGENYCNKYRRRNMSLSCPSCIKFSNNIDSKNTIRFPDTQSHLLHECVAFNHLHEELDVRKDSDLISFFRRIVETRLEDGDD